MMSQFQHFKTRYWWLYTIVLSLGFLLSVLLIFCHDCNICDNTNLLAQVDRLQHVIDQYDDPNPGVIPIEDDEIIIVEESVSCDTGFPYEGELIYPGVLEYNLGSSTGATTLFFNASAIPDRFLVYYNGRVVIDTGYRGLSTFNSIGNSDRNEFNASLFGKLDPLTRKTYPDKSISGTLSDGFPKVISDGVFNNFESEGEGTMMFDKNLKNVTNVTVKVFAPTNQTSWRIHMGCPEGNSNSTY